MPRTCKIRVIRAIRVRKKTFAYIKLNTNLPLPRIHTGSQPKQFVRFVRFVFEKKHSRILSWTLISHEYIPGRNLKDSCYSCDSCSKKTFAYVKLTTNLPNQTNHVICRQNQKTNPSTIPLVLSRNNQTKSKSKSNENQKTNPWKDSVSVFWFKLCSRRLTERNTAILSLYNIYIIGIWI